MADYVFVNISDHHFKVWGYDAFSNDTTGESEVITYWGRIGIPMHRLCKKRKNFNSWGDAYDYIRNKVDEKLCRGYKGFPNWMYFQMIQSPRGIAALIEKIANLGHERYYRTKRQAS